MAGEFDIMVRLSDQVVGRRRFGVLGYDWDRSERGSAPQRLLQYKNFRHGLRRDRTPLHGFTLRRGA